ncbi:vomeronasal type-1 receptor 4-like [Bubalus bubalis]|uniref:vomeronasal type-1 receptor 4-like n=1 Tax=Bubalus bubalis TaxID=89462 RepID=UPI00042D04BF|nr:vomeronasal type-1 receptor 4-like [Bubalus bubalis]
MSFHKDALRTTSQTALKTTYLIQIGVGSMANIILFFHNISPILLGHNRRPTPTILAHISLANLLFLLSSGIPHIMTGFVLRNPLSSLGCKFVYYIQRVARSTALCSTCVLSTYQSFTLTPRRAEWVMLRGRASKVTGPSCCTCWMFSLLMYIYVPVKITGPWDRYNNTDSQGKWFCSISGTVTGFGYFWFISDVMFIGLMVWSSGSMVLLLHRHHQRVQYIHTPTGHHRCAPETRAAHTILMLMVTYVIFYMLNYSFVFHISASLDFRLWLLQVSNVLVSCFPTISPFLLLLRDPRTPRFCS